MILYGFPFSSVLNITCFFKILWWISSVNWTLLSTYWLSGNIDRSKVGNCKQGGQERPSKAPLQFCFEQVGRVSIPCVFDCPVPSRQSPLTVMTFAKWHTDIYSIKSRKTSFDMLLISLVFSLVCLFSISLLSSHYYFLPFACFGINLHFLFYPHKVEA